MVLIPVPDPSTAAGQELAYCKDTTTPTPNTPIILMLMLLILHIEEGQG